MLVQFPLLLLDPVIMEESSFNFFGLKLEVLVQPLQSLLLEEQLSLCAGIADSFELRKLELVELSVLRDGGQHFQSVVLLGRQVYHCLLF